MARTYRIAVPLLLFWLLGWITLSWPAIQDDALIHLRYADNLIRHNFISYDGVHPDYGASSLLYVALLAALRRISASANLARGVSSAVHLLLFAGLAMMFWSRSKSWGATARVAALTLLVLVVMPGAVRWLDDGMETGIVATFATVLAWVLHSECKKDGGTRSPIRFLVMMAVGFFVILLRTELSLLCGVGFLLLVVSRRVEQDGKGMLAAVGGSAHLLLGAVAATGLIFSSMHTLLPDTALAKSRGLAHWFSPIHDTAVTLGGAMSFGAGMLIFWLITLALVLKRRGISGRLLLANCFFPVVLALAALRGQEIQGARYFAWTFFFAMVWNILELGDADESHADILAGRLLLYGFLVLLAIELPFEAVAMHRVLTHRGAVMREFEAQRLHELQGEHGIASDIGYIGYFTGATICDLAGLVNGRKAAGLSGIERAHACVQTNPDFIFANVSQLVPLTRMLDISQWQVCGSYDFTNVTTPDTHYLVVRPGFALAACAATSRAPEAIERILPATAGSY